MRARTIKQIRTAFLAAAEKDRQRIEQLRNDRDLTEDGRSKKTAPILKESGERFEVALERARRELAAARERFAEYQPRAMQMRASLTKPDRTTAVRAMATGASIADIMTMIEQAKKDADLPAAHGLRLALQSLPVTPSTEKTIGELHERLDGIVYREAEEVTADYVAARIEFNALADAGELGDISGSILKNPAESINRLREALAVEDEDGRTRHFNDADRVKMQELAGTIEPASDASAAA
jgi:hypothetical protein